MNPDEVIGQDILRTPESHVNTFSSETGSVQDTFFMMIGMWLQEIAEDVIP